MTLLSVLYCKMTVPVLCLGPRCYLNINTDTLLALNLWKASVLSHWLFLFSLLLESFPVFVLRCSRTTELKSRRKHNSACICPNDQKDYVCPSSRLYASSWFWAIVNSIGLNRVRIWPLSSAPVSYNHVTRSTMPDALRFLQWKQREVTEV